METSNHIIIEAENLIDDFGIGIKFLYDLDKDDKKFFYVKLNQSEAKELTALLIRTLGSSNA